MLKMLKNYHYWAVWNWFSFGSGQNDCLKFAVWLFMGRSKSATVAGETTSTEQQRGNREEKMEDINGPAKVGQGFGSRGVMQARCKSQPSSTWRDTSLVPRESVSKCSRPTRSWRSGWRQTSMRRWQAARPRITCPASSAWVVLSRNMLTVESFGVLGHSRPLRPNCLSLEIDCDSTLLYSAQLLSI